MNWGEEHELKSVQLKATLNSVQQNVLIKKTMLTTDYNAMQEVTDCPVHDLEPAVTWK